MIVMKRCLLTVVGGECVRSLTGGDDWQLRGAIAVWATAGEALVWSKVWVPFSSGGRLTVWHMVAMIPATQFFPQ